MLEAIGLAKYLDSLVGRAGELPGEAHQYRTEVGKFSSRSYAACRACGGLCAHIQ